jgi:hypothetical protein
MNEMKEQIIFICRFLINEIEDRSNRNEENSFRNVRLFFFVCSMSSSSSYIYIHFKLVLSLFNRRATTLSLSLSMLANDEKKTQRERI